MDRYYAAVVFFIGFVITYVFFMIAAHKLPSSAEREAVKVGHAYWASGSDGSPVFTWSATTGKITQ